MMTADRCMNIAVTIIAIGVILITSILVYDKLAPAPAPLNVDMDSLYDDYMYPGASRSEEVPILKAIVSYPKDRVYEGDEFRVDVIDQMTKLPLEGANVSFMRPEIRLSTDKYGVVFFSAPKIQKQYLRESLDTWCKFPLLIEKEGYLTFRQEIFVFMEND